MSYRNAGISVSIVHGMTHLLCGLGADSLRKEGLSWHGQIEIPLPYILHYDLLEPLKSTNGRLLSTFMNNCHSYHHSF